MPVLPNDPQIPLWVLRTVPRSRDRAGYAAAIWSDAGGALLSAVLAAVIVPDLARVPQAPAPGEAFLGPVCVFVVVAYLASELLQIGRRFAARRWLDRAGRWPDVARLGWDEEAARSQRAWAIGNFAAAVALGVAFIVYGALR